MDKSGPVDLDRLTRSAGFGQEGLQIRAASRPSGVTLADLIADPDLLAATVDGYAGYQRESFGPSARRDIAALWLLQDISWLHGVLAVGILPAHGVSLLAEPQALGMDLPRDMHFVVEANPEGITRVFAADAAERAAVYAGARGHLSSLFEPFVGAMTAHLKAGPRSFWAAVTDMTTGALNSALSHDRIRLAAEFGLLTRPGGDGDHLLTGGELGPSPTGPLRRRHGCCLLYAIDGMDLCHSCPRIPFTPAS